MTTLQEWSFTDDLELNAAQVETLANTDRFVLRPQPGASHRWRLSATSYVGVARIGVPGIQQPALNGTYYVRVRGENACGIGPASDERVLVVSYVP